jgi:hypothetical protein
VQRFITGPVLWSPGETRLHVYVLPDLDGDPDLADLIRRSRNVIAGYPAIAPVPDGWLHATVQMIAGVPAAGVHAIQRALLVNALKTRLADVPAFTVTAGPPIATRSGVLLDVDGDQAGGPWTVMATAVRAAIADVLGAPALARDPGPPHISLGYGVGDEDSGVVSGALRRRVRPGRAPLGVRAVWLVDVTQDAERSEYRWEPVSRIGLRAPADQIDEALDLANAVRCAQDDLVRAANAILNPVDAGAGLDDLSRRVGLYQAHPNLQNRLLATTAVAIIMAGSASTPAARNEIRTLLLDTAGELANAAS